MQAASRQSYLVAQERLDAYVDSADPEQLRSLADEVLAVARMLSEQVQLRRALADPSRSGEDRAGLLNAVLGNQLGQATKQLLGTLVSGRWSAASELLDGCELLAVQALLASGERAGALAEVEDELFRFSQLVASDRQLAGALGDWRRPATERAWLVDELLGGKASDVTIQAVKIALGGFGGRSVETALARMVELAAARRDRSVAYVTAAAPLSEAEEQRLGAALSARYGRDVSVKTTVDPRVLGGLRVRVGADLYEGTVAHRLAQARNALASR
jgi:F-type H+-transporting ATPase subunit delta